jgi:hypothetical protein
MSEAKALDDYYLFFSFSSLAIIIFIFSPPPSLADARAFFFAS